MLKVMTPLWGTKTPSALVGAKSGGDRRAARSLLSCAAWGGYGAAMARHGRHGAPRAAVRAPSAPATGPFGFSRNTRHESRLLCFPTHHFPAISHHFPVKNLPLSQYPRPVRPSRLASRRTPSAEAPVALRAASAAAKVQSAMLRKGNTSSEVFTKHGFYAFHESQLLRPFGSPWVREGWRHKKPPSGPLPPPPSHCFTVHHCSLLFTIVRHCSPKKYCPAPVSPLRPHRQHGLFGFHETRATSHGLCCGAAWGGYGAAWAAWGAPNRCPRSNARAGNRTTAFRVFTKHETRDTKHGFFLACCGRRVVRNAG